MTVADAIFARYPSATPDEFELAQRADGSLKLERWDVQSGGERVPAPDLGELLQWVAEREADAEQQAQEDAHALALIENQMREANYRSWGKHWQQLTTSDILRFGWLFLYKHDAINPDGTVKNYDEWGTG